MGPPRDVPGTALMDGAGASTVGWDAEGLKSCWRVLGTLAPKGSRRGTRGCRVSAPSWWHGGLRTREVARRGSGLRLQQHHPHHGKVSDGYCPSETPRPGAAGAEQHFLQQETPPVKKPQSLGHQHAAKSQLLSKMGFFHSPPALHGPGWPRGTVTPQLPARDQQTTWHEAALGSKKRTVPSKAPEP